MAEQVENVFNQRVDYVSTVESEYQKAQKIIAALQAETVDRAESARQLAEELKAKDALVASLRQ